MPRSPPLLEVLARATESELAQMVDYLKTELGGDRVALIDAHQPAFEEVDGDRVFHLNRSIDNVVATSLRALGVPNVIVRDLLESRREEAEQRTREDA